MSYLTRDELQSHIYGPVISEINREDNLQEYATMANFPAIGTADVIYKALDTGLYYQWAINAYSETKYTDNVEVAILTAIEEAKGYLTAYDLNAIFTAIDADRNPVLLLYVKDIAVWHFIQLANPAVDMELREKRFNNAVKWLDKVQRGITNPNLPYPAVDPDVEPSQYIKTGTNTKRENYF